MKIPRKHLHLLNNPCSIYEVSSQSFKPVFGGLKGEYRTTKIVKVLSEEKYKSAKDCMIKHGVKIKVIK